RRFVRSVDAAVPPDPFRHRSETFDSLAPPPGPEEPKVSPPLLFPAEEEARAQRTRRELIDAVVQMKQRNPTWGCPRIAQQIALAFAIPIDKTWFEGSSPVTTDRNRPPGGHPG